MSESSDGNGTNSLLSETAAQLRAEFDRTFSLPPRQTATHTRDFVIVQVSGEAYALDAAAIRGIERSIVAKAGFQRVSNAGDDSRLQEHRSPAALREWVRVPSLQPALLGIQAFNGQIVPVFALSTLLGVKAQFVPAHCALVVAGEDVIGLAFDDLLRFARVQEESLFSAGAGAQSWQEATLSDAGEVYPVVGIASLLKSIRAIASHSAPIAFEQALAGTRNIQDGSL